MWKVSREQLIGYYDRMKMWAGEHRRLREGQRAF